MNQRRLKVALDPSLTTEALPDTTATCQFRHFPERRPDELLPGRNQCQTAWPQPAVQEIQGNRHTGSDQDQGAQGQWRQMTLSAVRLATRRSEGVVARDRFELPTPAL